MARKGRETSPVGIYHIILRSEKKLFLTDIGYNKFYELMKKYFTSSEPLFAYSLSKSKIHLVFFTDSDISNVLKPLCTSYARFCNREYNYIGRLFYDRYISKPVNDYEELNNVITYVAHMNDALTSLNEYSGNESICNLKKIKKKIDLDKIISPDIIIPCDDDYISMSDNELKKHILYCSGLKNTLSDRKKLTEFILLASQNSNLSKSRLLRIFELKAPQARKTTDKKALNTDNKTNNEQKPENIKETPEEKPVTTQEKQKEEAPKKKKELSVWLL